MLSAWWTHRPRGRALTGATGINPRRSSRRRPNRSLGCCPFFFFFFFDSTRALCPRHSVLGPIRPPDPVDVPDLAFQSLRPRDATVPHLGTLSHIPSVCVSPSASILPSLLFTNTTTCKKRGASTLTWPLLRPPHPPVIHPTAGVKGGTLWWAFRASVTPFYPLLLRQPNHTSSFLSAVAIRP